MDHGFRWGLDPRDPRPARHAWQSMQVELNQRHRDTLCGRVIVPAPTEEIPEAKLYAARCEQCCHRAWQEVNRHLPYPH